MFNSNGDCLTSQTTFAGGANPEHVYGCILGAVVDTTQSNPLAKAVSVSGTGPAAVAAALSFMAGSGGTFPPGNMQWQWDPIQKAYRTLHTDPNTGITTLVDLRATFVPTPITLPLQTTNAIQRPDGGYATSDLIFNP